MIWGGFIKEAFLGQLGVPAVFPTRRGEFLGQHGSVTGNGFKLSVRLGI